MNTTNSRIKNRTFPTSITDSPKTNKLLLKNISLSKPPIKNIDTSPSSLPKSVVPKIE